MKSTLFIIAILSITLQGCLPEVEENSINTQLRNCTKDIPTSSVPDSLKVVDFMSLDSLYGKRHTVDTSLYSTAIRFENYSVVLHHFAPFTNKYSGIKYFTGEYFEDEVSILRDDLERREQPFIVNADTLSINETTAEKFNNTLIQIFPKSSQDRFVVSMGYIVKVLEKIDDSNSESGEEDFSYESLSTIKEVIKLEIINDSAKYFFKIPHYRPYMEMETTLDTGSVFDKKNSILGLKNNEKDFLKKEIDRVKAKYQLKDTLVVIPRGEKDILATLTNNGKLYSFHHDSFFLRIDRCYRKELLESKYIRISYCN